MIRPVFLFGNGLRNNPELVAALCKLNVPVLTSWQAADLVPEDSPVFCGRPGVIGQRAANIIQQKCNWLMVVGARLDNEQIAHNLDGFAPDAHKTIVDVDPAELQKFPDTWSKRIIDLTDPESTPQWRGLPFISEGMDGDEWLKWCKDLYNTFRPELEGRNDSEFVDPYSFIDALSAACGEGDILVPGSSGMQSCAFFQAFKVKEGQRILACNTIGSMGLEPMAIGAAISSGRRVIVITGDGGFSQNIQELEIVKRLNLPIHYFVFDNSGYGSIAATQDTRFGLRVGSTPESGFTLPDLHKIANVWGMRYMNIHDNTYLSQIDIALGRPESSIVRVRTSLSFRYACKVQSEIIDGVMVPDPMQDMTPKLDHEKLQELMK